MSLSSGYNLKFYVIHAQALTWLPPDHICWVLLSLPIPLSLCMLLNRISVLWLSNKWFSILTRWRSILNWDSLTFWKIGQGSDSDIIAAHCVCAMDNVLFLWGQRSFSFRILLTLEMCACIHFEFWSQNNLR